MAFQYALKEIKRRKLRSSANIVGYIIAVAFLIIAVTLAQGYNIVATGSLNGIGTHFAVYIPASKACPCAYGEVGPFFRDVYTPTFNLSVVDTIKQQNGVADAAPVLMFRLENLTICGIDVTFLATQTTVVSTDEVIQGNYLTADNLNGVMVDSVFADVTGLKVGDTLAVFDHNFTVVGIVNPGLHSKPVGIANMYAPLSMVQEIARHYGDLYDFPVGDINIVAVEVAPEGDLGFIGTVQQSALNTLEDYAGHAGALVGYKCGFTARKIISVTEGSAWAISLVLIFSATLFSLKSQFGTVVERTKEIGVLKAIGWTDIDITKQVFIESLLQSLVGALVGVGIGCLAIVTISQFGLVNVQNLVLDISPLMVAIALAVSVGGGVIAGVFPAWWASKLSPADALRRF